MPNAPNALRRAAVSAITAKGAMCTCGQRARPHIAIKPRVEVDKRVCAPDDVTVPFCLMPSQNGHDVADAVRAPLPLLDLFLFAHRRCRVGHGVPWHANLPGLYV